MSSGDERGPIVVKIGGSTLGSEDTTLEDVVALRKRGERVIVVHGGGSMISDWLERLDVPSVFIDGLRSTNEEALDVVIAVLRGVVNTHFVAAIERLGGRAVGLSGVDGGLIQARRRDERLGYVGEVIGVDREALRPALESGAVPVIAPIGLEPPGQPLNINADTVAGEIARAVGASLLVFLTDVEGVMDGHGRLIEELDAGEAATLRENGTVAGGMIPKIDAGLRAAERGAAAHVADGRLPRTLERIVSGEFLGDAGEGLTLGFFEDREDRGDLGPPPEPFRIGGGGFRSPVAPRWIGLAAAIVLLLVIANVAKSIYVDFLWFDSVGFEGNFQRVLIARVVLFAIGAVLTALVLGVNIWLARRLAPEGVEESFIEDVDPEAIRRVVTVLLIAMTIFLALVFGAVTAGSWETILTWLNAVDFGVEDSQFNRDISFYLFDLPAYHFIQGWVLSLLVVSTLGAGAVYGLTFSLQRFELNLTRGMKIHVSVLAGLILLVIAFGTWLSVFDLATSPEGIVAGATYADVNARIPVRYVLVALGAFAGLATIANGILNSGWRVPAFAIGLWVIAGIGAGFIYPSFIQSFQVDPNELEKEERFIARNIEGTRRAWGLDQIVVTNFAAEAAVTEEELEANQPTLDNVRLLDARPTRDTFNQIQSIRPLYQFDDVDVDRYLIDGSPAQVMVAARELDLRRATQTGGSGWTQRRLQFTHGYGAVVAPVNTATPEGLPVLLTRDIPPIGEDVPITESGARIYFGELTDHYIVVKTNEPEFDYPTGDTTVETTYEPDRGIRLSNILRRFALAWDLGDRNLLISGQLSSDSRVLMNRSLDDRIHKVAPFLELDADPYLVVIDGGLIWIQDAYTTSGDFPYSQHLGTINYIRNSVKVVVDAETGDMTFYVVDPDDPVAATWAKIFPDLFTSADEMDDLHPGVREHLRYPEDLFQLQAQQYLRYHIEEPRTFFIGEDLWAIPTEKFRQQEQPLEPYYVIMKLPGESSEEFSLIMPFTPRNKQNTIAWLAARSDGEHLGGLRAYRFPTDDLVFGPAQIEARIDQDPGISAQFSLWDTGGSEVIRGNLLMIPIGESFLFIEPIYLQAENSRIPELKRVVVANGNNIALETTFQRSLDVVFGRRASSLPGSDEAFTNPPPAATPTPSAGGDDDGGVTPSGDLGELLRQAQGAADATQRELDRLRAILQQIEDSQDE